MEETWTQIRGWATTENLLDVAAALFVLVVGLILARAAAAGTVRVFGNHLDPQQRMLVRRGVFYPLAALVLVSVLQQLDFVDLSVFLGAAGLLTVAIGFASQTAASNIISGLFLLGERPFVVGEVIEIGGTVGEVVAINWVSARLRTFDNRLVRIPNESLLKSQIVNLTRNPLRRVDIKVAVAYGSDLGQVREVLMGLADANPLSLDEPKPVFLVLGFGESGVDLQFSIWGRRESFLELSSGMKIAIYDAFAAAGIEIPLPHRKLVTAEAGGAAPLLQRRVHSESEECRILGKE